MDIMFAMKIEADWLIVMKNALNEIGLFRYSVFSGVPVQYYKMFGLLT